MYKRCLRTVLKEARQRCFTDVRAAEEAKANFQSRFIAPCTRWTAVTNSKGEKSIGGMTCLLLQTVFFDGIFQVEIMYKTAIIQRCIGHRRGVVIAEPTFDRRQFVGTALETRARAHDIVCSTRPCSLTSSTSSTGVRIISWVMGQRKSQGGGMNACSLIIELLLAMRLSRTTRKSPSVVWLHRITCIDCHSYRVLSLFCARVRIHEDLR